MENEIEIRGYPKRIATIRLKTARAFASPALRGRKEDIAALAEYSFVESFEAARKENTEPGGGALGSAGISLAGKHPGAGKPHQEKCGGWHAEEALLESPHGAPEQVKTQEKSATSSLKIAAKAASGRENGELIFGRVATYQMDTEKRAAREPQSLQIPVTNQADRTSRQLFCKNGEKMRNGWFEWRCIG